MILIVELYKGTSYRTHILIFSATLEVLVHLLQYFNPTGTQISV